MPPPASDHHPSTPEPQADAGAGERKRPFVLLTIPAFNEAKRLPSYLEHLLPLLGELSGPGGAGAAEVQVQIVDDGSRPEHRDTVRADIDRRRPAHPHLRLSLLELPENLGKGGAILAGWREVPEADFYGFLDSDGAIAAPEVCRLILNAIARKEPCALFASRVQMLGKKVDRSLARHVIGRFFAWLVTLFINKDVYDSQCGFKLLPASHFNRIAKYLRGHRFAFDAELIAALSVQSLAMEEVPIDWSDVAGSKVSFLKDAVRMFRSIIEIHFGMKNGHYGG